MTPIGLQLYRASLALMSPLAPALLRARAKKGKEDPKRLDERLGLTTKPRPSGPLIWLHGASVGEGLSLIPLVTGLRQRRNDLNILVTTGTVTAAELVMSRLKDDVVHQYAALDVPAAARRFAGHWRPDAAVFVESEIWPNLIQAAKAEGAKMALLSARLSQKSLTGWSRAPKAARAIFGAFDLVMAQDEQTALALARLGARDDGRLNLKRAAPALPVNLFDLQSLKAAAAGRPVLLAASTHPGEEAIVLAAMRRADLKDHLVIAPRHPVRGPEIADLSRSAGFTTALRSAGARFGEAQVYVADTLGELGLWFSLADLSMVGGSLVAGIGGHNPLEAVRLGCPIVVGPHLENWRAVYEDLLERNGVGLVKGEIDLAEAFRVGVGQSPLAKIHADAALSVLKDDAEGLARALDSLLSFVP